MISVGGKRQGRGRRGVINKFHDELEAACRKSANRKLMGGAGTVCTCGCGKRKARIVGRLKACSSPHCDVTVVSI